MIEGDKLRIEANIGMGLACSKERFILSLGPAWYLGHT